MQLILVHHRLSAARTLVIRGWHLAAVGAVVGVFVLLGAVMAYLLLFQTSATSKMPWLKGIVSITNTEEQRQKDAFLRQNLDELAKRVGEMQAQMLRLDALGERVSGLAGVKPEFNFRELPGRGGAEPSVTKSLSATELKAQMDQLASAAGQRNDYLNVVESTLLSQAMQHKFLPTSQPVNGVFGSGFGWRNDPIHGRSAFHEGIDFNAPTGTSVMAAAGGVVVAQEWHNGFGNLIEIDHGNDIMTRYAHNSKVLVKPGQVVKRGQKIAEVGSTGRSTGPHLHFEALVRGNPVDPNKFLAGSLETAKKTAAAGAHGKTAE